jgi:hypothetical protein
MRAATMAGSLGKMMRWDSSRSRQVRTVYRFNTHRTASDLRIHEISYAAR